MPATIVVASIAYAAFMGSTLTIRNLDESVWQKLRIQAARHGRSMEAEVREILARDVLSNPATGAEASTDGEALAPVSGRFDHLIGMWKGRMSADEVMKVTRGKQAGMPILVDSNVILDIVTQDPVWLAWSNMALLRHVSVGLLANAMVYAELCCNADSIGEVDSTASAFPRIEGPSGVSEPRRFQDLRLARFFHRCPCPDFGNRNPHP